MIARVLVLVLVLALEAGAQTFPTPGPGHVPWTAGASSGFATSHWPNWEARCEYIEATYDPTHSSNALGCRCNETLDATDSPVDSNPNSSTTSGGVNYECNGGGFLDLGFAGSTYVNASDTTFGDALPGSASKILQVDTSNDTGNSHGGFFSFTGRTFCSRDYEKLQTNFPVPNGGVGFDGRIKFGRWHSGDSAGADHPGFESSTRTACDGSNASTCGFQWDYSQKGPVFGVSEATFNGGTGAPSMAAILGKWVRIETCFDHYTSGPNNGKLRYRVRFTRIADGAEWSSNDLSPSTSATVQIAFSGAGGNADYPWEAYTQNLSGSNRRRMYSSTLLAIIPTDETFWIGKGCELEGGC